MKKLKESRNEDFFESDTILTNCIYIGDPCYFMLEDVYNEWGARYNYGDGAIESKLRNSAFIVCGTKYGDGEYDSDQNGKKFPVDAGCICIADGNLGDAKKLKSAKELGLFIPLPKLAPTTISLSYEDGTITAKYSQGKTSQSVSIFTDEDEDDEWEDSSDDWEDDVDDSDEFNESTHTCEICGKPATESLRGSSNEFIRTAIEQFGCSHDGYVCLDCCDKIGDEMDSEYGTGFEGVDFYEESTHHMKESATISTLEEFKSAPYSTSFDGCTQVYIYLGDYETEYRKIKQNCWQHILNSPYGIGGTLTDEQIFEKSSKADKAVACYPDSYKFKEDYSIPTCYMCGRRRMSPEHAKRIHPSVNKYAVRKWGVEPKYYCDDCYESVAQDAEKAGYLDVDYTRKRVKSGAKKMTNINGRGVKIIYLGQLINAPYHNTDFDKSTQLYIQNGDNVKEYRKVYDSCWKRVAKDGTLLDGSIDDDRMMDIIDYCDFNTAYYPKEFDPTHPGRWRNPDENY